MSDRLHDLLHKIEHAAHLLPAQGPITVFIHHNTLHAFEELTFDQAVIKGSRVFGCHPYLSEDRYRAELARGRIRGSDLTEVLKTDLGHAGHERIANLCSRFEFRQALLQYPAPVAPDIELIWFIAETQALRHFRRETSAVMRGLIIERTRNWIMRDVRGRFGNQRSQTTAPRDPIFDLLKDAFEELGERRIETWNLADWEQMALQALWRVCRAGTAHLPTATKHRDAELVRARDLLLRATGVDTDTWVHDLLIRFCSAYLDQGVAGWRLPSREVGFWEAFCTLYGRPGGPPDPWLRRLPAELHRLQQQHFTPLQVIAESLQLLGVTAEQEEEFLSETLLALRGWGGMLRQVELRGDRVAIPIPEGSLVGFLAVRLVLDRLAAEQVAADELGHRGPLTNLRQVFRTHPRPSRTAEQQALLLFQLAQVLGWSAPELYQLDRIQWTSLVRELEAFSGFERRRLFHQAYERRFRNQVLDAVAVHNKPAPTSASAPPRFQIITCIDEREESFRRHLEEQSPDVETWGAAGFFSVAMYYRGAEDAHFVPLCPVVIRPQHWVVEQANDPTHQKWARWRRLLGSMSHSMHRGTRNAVAGVGLAILGIITFVPLIARILFPRLTGRLLSRAGMLVRPDAATNLIIERSTAAPGHTPENALGFSVEEMANMLERLLRDLGLTDRFARIVTLIGHGSNSMNNPHKSAYDCGACGGSSGGPNARTMARIGNDPRVREVLRRRGLVIPETTYFVGGFHNTCNDRVVLADPSQVPATHTQDFADLTALIEAACDRNAHERCRRFMSAPLDMTFPAARAHVENRAEDLGQTRPECGHATNAICVVGRRSRTKGLFLDRRAFLVSYDPTQDDETCAILTRILGAVVPVCGGISLEYYFSYVDSPGWGCGTKLPHNVTGLLGVMDGAASDLRTGLPWQMVEIHEPVRLLMVIETTPAKMQRILDANPSIGNVCRNEWIQLAVLAPGSSEIQLLTKQGFQTYHPEITELTKVASSVDWYRGWRDHLDFAEIDPGIADANGDRFRSRWGSTLPRGESAADGGAERTASPPTPTPVTRGAYD